MHFYTPSKRVCARVITTLLASAFMLIVVCQLPTTHAATTFTVNSLADTPDAAPGNGTCADAGGACTLRAAIAEANSLSGDDIISFSVTGTINLTGALPILSSNVIINGPGSSLLTVRRDTGGNYRIFQTSGNSSISGLTITNGRTPDGVAQDINQIAPSGGGIWQTGGSLTLRDVVITGNTTGNASPNSFSFGGFGGGIYASGTQTQTLTMTDCVISNNTTGNGSTPLQNSSSGGRGAGIFFTTGTLRLTNVLVTGNRTGDSGNGASGGRSGYGGGIWAGVDFPLNQPTNLVLNKVTITNNSTGSGLNFGDTGDGGGIYLQQGTMSLTDSIVSNNHTGDTNLSLFSGQAGRGGGVLNNGTLTLTNSLISGNTTGDNSSGSNNNGGGIASFGALTLINTTVSGNHTGSGAGIGGGVFAFGQATLINCTVTDNSTTGDQGNGVGGFNSTITLANSIVAGNGDSSNDRDMETTIFTPATFVSLGHNLIGNVDGVTGFNVAGDQTGTGAAPLNPHLGPLANNGGPSMTHALLTNSTALDAGDNNLAIDQNNNPLPTDQRGAQRISDSPDADSTATVDIGAFEFLQTLEDIPNKTTNEDVPITFTFGLGDNGPAVTSVTASSSNQSAVPDANLILSGTGAARSLQITPAANQSGIAMITVTVNLSGGGSLTDTFTLTVTPVNDRPSFSIAAVPAVLEDTPAQTVLNFATNISAGPLEEAQSVSFSITGNSNPTLFSAAPAVSSSGTLTYTPAPNAYGNALVTLVLIDNGGTANGGEDTSTAQTFTISITPVNDVPTFTKGANQTVNEDAGFQFVSNWATNISPGPNESDGLMFQVTNNTNSSLFSQQPAVAVNGLLTYTPAFNASGSADITIVLRDTGGTANGGVDVTAPQTFTITVNAVNDAPLISFTSFVQTNQQTPLVFSGANFNGIGLSDVDAGSDPVRVTLTATQGTLTLSSTAGLTFDSGDGVDDATMNFTGFIGTINFRLNGLTFKPNNGFAGIATLQVVVNDEGHNGAGGPKSATANISINVLSGGRFSFNTGNYGVNETGSTATITVLRAGGNAGTATVNYATSDGTATSGTSCTSGVDYLPASGTFTWNNGDSSVRTFTITICNDGSNEFDETINLTLSNAGGTGSLGTQPTSTLTIGNDDAPVLLTEALTQHAIALELVSQTRDPFSLTSPFNFGVDQRNRVSLFVWRLGLLPGDTVASVQVTARDDEGRIYDLPVEALNPLAGVADVTQVVVRLPDSVIAAPRDLQVKVTLRGPGSNEAFIKIAAP